jgi:GTA TIM-barrel-like domain/Putative phage tail protein
MATLVLGAVGSALGGAFGGTILGLSGAAIGGFIGSTIGSVVDQWIVGSFAPNQNIQGARLDALRVTSSTEGSVIPRIYGRMRVGGNLIWATDFLETVKTEEQGGGKGGGGKVTTTTYLYSANFAIALCEGPITGIGRIWADGKPLDRTGVTMRVYLGGEDQFPDPLIVAKVGANRAPAYRGTAYVVFDNMPLEAFGNRIPQLTFEVFSPLADADTAEGKVKAVTMIPASGEFAYSTSVIKKTGASTGFAGASAGSTVAINANAQADVADFVGSLDRMESLAPSVESVSLVVSWFGNDLRAGDCQFKPKVDRKFANDGGFYNYDAVSNLHYISYVDGLNPPPAGLLPQKSKQPFRVQNTSSGPIVVQVYYDDEFWYGISLATGATATVNAPPPFFNQWVKLTSVGGQNFRAYSDTAGQVVVSTSPYIWQVGPTVRSTADVVSYREGKPAFGGTPADRSVVEALTELQARGKRVTFYPFVMMDIAAGNGLPDPYSDNAATAGQPRYPWRGRITCSPAAGFVGSVDKTATAAAQVAALFGSVTPAQFGITGTTVNYTGPAGDWGYRRMILHYAYLCAAVGGINAFLIGSELRGITTIRDAAGNYPGVAALITLAGEVKTILGPDVKVSYAADWSEYFGHHPQDGTGDVFFHLDPLWSNANIDFIGVDNYMPVSDWRDGFDHLDATAWPSIYDRDYLRSNVEGGEGFDWFYSSLANRVDQIRTPITDGAGKPWVFRYKDLRAWWQNQHFNRPGGVEALTPTAWVPQSKPFWFTEIGCPAVDRGTNQPNVFSDPKSSESLVPYFSRGYRDDAIQRAYLEAVLGYWSEAANNPTSTVYGDPMIRTDESAVWTWDARPYPFYPERTDVWSDGPNWALGHWLTGRLGAVSLAALVRNLCVRAGMPEAQIDVTDLYGSIEGYAIAALESPRTSAATLARHFGFDGLESDGKVRFVMRGRVPSTTITPDDMIASDDPRGEMFELTRQQTTDLPLALKWAVVRSDEDYDPAMVEARRITTDTTRTAAESFPVAVPPVEAERRCKRALFEAWVGIENLIFALPPSRMALDPTDVILFDHDGRRTEFRIQTTADEVARRLEGIRQDRFAYDLPPGKARPSGLLPPTTFGPPNVAFLDIPQLTDAVPAYQPYIAGDADPWPGSLAVVRSPALDGFTLQTLVNRRATMGTLVTDLPRGVFGYFDHNEMIVDVGVGTLASVTDVQLFGGANAFAVEVAPGLWEILQAGQIDLIDVKRYRMTRLLRGQKGSEHRMASPAPAGARVVALDLSVYPLPVADVEVGLPFNWRVGPAPRPISDDSYIATAFTPAGEGLRPFAPCHVGQPAREGHTPGDYLIHWKRRDRALSADSWESEEIVMSEASEAYEVDILNGTTVVRTLTTTVPSVLYTGAMQIADFGSLRGPGTQVSIRVYQISARLGRGAPKFEVLQF